MVWAGEEQEASQQLQQLEGQFCYMLQQAGLREMAGSPAKTKQRVGMRHEGLLLSRHLPVLILSSGQAPPHLCGRQGASILPLQGPASPSLLVSPLSNCETQGGRCLSQEGAPQKHPMTG